MTAPRFGIVLLPESLAGLGARREMGGVLEATVSAIPAGH